VRLDPLKVQNLTARWNLRRQLNKAAKGREIPSAEPRAMKPKSASDIAETFLSRIKAQIAKELEEEQALEHSDTSSVYVPSEPDVAAYAAPTSYDPGFTENHNQHKNNVDVYKPATGQHNTSPPAVAPSPRTPAKFSFPGLSKPAADISKPMYRPAARVTASPTPTHQPVTESAPESQKHTLDILSLPASQPPKPALIDPIVAKDDTSSYWEGLHSSAEKQTERSPQHLRKEEFKQQADESAEDSTSVKSESELLEEAEEAEEEEEEEEEDDVDSTVSDQSDHVSEKSSSKGQRDSVSPLQSGSQAASDRYSSPSRSPTRSSVNGEQMAVRTEGTENTSEAVLLPNQAEEGEDETNADEASLRVKSEPNTSEPVQPVLSEEPTATTGAESNVKEDIVNVTPSAEGAVKLENNTENVIDQDMAVEAPMEVIQGSGEPGNSISSN